MAERLQIVSPKRNKRLQSGWEGFFPYYAGYPELFARGLLQSAELPSGAESPFDNYEWAMRLINNPFMAAWIMASETSRRRSSSSAQ